MSKSMKKRGGKRTTLWTRHYTKGGIALADSCRHKAAYFIRKRVRVHGHTGMKLSEWYEVSLTGRGFRGDHCTFQDAKVAARELLEE